MSQSVREFCIAQALKREGNYRLYKEGDELPKGYASYCAYDGVDLIAGGMTRDLAMALRDLSYRLGRASIGIFIWKPDEDGSVQRWMEYGPDKPSPDKDEEVDNVCRYCHGTGERV